MKHGLFIVKRFGYFQQYQHRLGALRLLFVLLVSAPRCTAAAGVLWLYRIEGANGGSGSRPRIILMITLPNDARVIRVHNNIGVILFGGITVLAQFSPERRSPDAELLARCFVVPVAGFECFENVLFF